MKTSEYIAITRTTECYICGEEIKYRSRNAPIYCPRHRSEAKRDSQIIKHINLEKTFEIVAAILHRAKEDYITNDDNQRSDAEVFFKSNWAQIMTNGALVPELVFEELDRRIYELDQIREDIERTEWE